MNAVGGQAVVEGVMMRSARRWAVSVRRPDGRITTIERESVSLAVRHPFLRWPVLRGIIALGESLAIGYRALGLASQYAASDDGDEDTDPPSELSRGALIAAFAIAIGFTIIVFKVGPSLLASLLGLEGTGTFLIAEGVIKVALLVGYMAALNLIPDIRRVFQYHAAEHMTINALEAGDPLTPDAVGRHSKIHLRCGTAFLLWVMLVSVVVFMFVGRPGTVWLVLSRILLLPLIAGLAYEVIRLASRFGANPVVHLLLLPGLWLQQLTTRNPSPDQLEVAIAALERVIGPRVGEATTPAVEVMA